MSVTAQRRTVLEIINEVEKKLALNVSATLTDTTFTEVLLRYLNDTVADCADAGDWRELYFETTVTATSSVATYAITASAGPVHHVYEIAFEDQIAPLYSVDISDINRLNRLNSYGVPRQYCIKEVNASADPVFAVYPTPGSTQDGKAFTVSGFYRPPIYTTSDASVVVPFPAEVMILGLHARALLEENGGEPTQSWRMTSQEYENRKQQALNRWTTDQGFETRLVPGRGRR